MKKIFNLIKKIQIALMSQTGYQKYLMTVGVKIGKNCSIDKSVIFGTEAYLIEIGNNVRLTHNVQFITHDGSIGVLRNMELVEKDADIFGKIVIEDNVNIGWNSVIMPGVTIGNNSIIGANTIVTKDVPPHSVCCGTPGKVIKTVEEYAEKVKDKIVHTKGLKYDEKKKFLLLKYDKEG